jgi:hypothetical protein
LKGAIKASNRLAMKLIETNQLTMKIGKINPLGCVSVTLTQEELATINDALSMRLAISKSPRLGHHLDKLTEKDYQLCEELDRKTFGLFCQVADSMAS